MQFNKNNWTCMPFTVYKVLPKDASYPSLPSQCPPLHTVAWKCSQNESSYVDTLGNAKRLRGQFWFGVGCFFLISISQMEKFS